jgi:DNA-binding response OmpR family regulator
MEKEIHGADRLSILVVDDDRAMSKVIRQNLEDKDTQVLEVGTGLDGIKILVESRVDLVLLDIKLPDVSGWGILSLLKLTEWLCHIPVIVVSVEPPEAVLMERLRPEDYIQKPFDMRDLLERVRAVIDSEKINQRLTGKIK